MRRRPPARRPVSRAASSRPEEVATITIDRLAAGGDGVGRLDGFAIFVPRTAPGDVVQVAFIRHARFGRGRVLQLITPSATRVAPTCVHYERDRCGGCQLQHLEADAQRLARRQIVQETLQRVGRRDVSLPTLLSGDQWGYRGRLTLTLHRKGHGWIGGLHPHDDASRVFALEMCPIAHPSLVHAWDLLRDLARRVALPFGDRLRLSFRLERGGVAVVIDGGTAWPSAAAMADAMAAAGARRAPEAGAVTALWWIDAARTAHPIWLAEGGAPVPAAEPAREPQTDDPHVEYAPAADEALAFAQVNAPVASALRDRVEAAVQHFAPARVIDAYAGAGPLAERLVRLGLQVLAIESDAAGANAAVARLSGDDTDVRRRLRVVCDVVEEALPAMGAFRADVVVLNPPRSGVAAAVTGWLEAAPASVRGVVYVSCNPATLARDLARLPSWRVQALECFDMFPQTAHVESVCVLHRSPMGETA